MPTYDYQCDACNHVFDLFETIANRDQPCSAPCPACNKSDVRRGFITAPTAGVDFNVTADSVAPGFNEVMDRMRTLVPKKDQWVLDSAQSNTGGRLGLGHRR